MKRVFLTACALLTALACATTQPSKTTELRFPPVHIVAGPELPDALDHYDETTLFERGVELLDAGANEDAILYFERLLTEYPDSKYAKSSTYNLGAALSNLHRCEAAIEAFDAYLPMLDLEYEYQDSVDARFKKGVCLAELSRYRDVVELFDQMLVETSLQPTDKIEALVDSGIGHFMLGDHVTAEYRMRDAIRIHRQASRLERLESDYHVAQAHFYIGEIYRAEFSRLKLELPPPGEGQKDAMVAQLEDKCQRLLRAQYAYIRAIKVGNAGWASASGYKIGTLYEDLYDDMVYLPVPKDLTDEQAALYVLEMKRRVHVLVKKAIKVWERSLDMANRTGADNEWVRRTETSLERLRKLMAQTEDELREDDGGAADSPASQPAPPTGAGGTA